MPMREMAVKTVPIVALIGAVLGGIYAGLFTATEAGAVGALMALVIALLRSKLSLRSFWGVLTETGHVTVSVSFLIICANVYTRMLAMSGTPQAMVGWMAAAGFGVAVFLLIYVLLVLLLGTVIDSSSILLIVLPLMLPVAEQFGLNLIWFGVITVVAVEIGLLTPPFGLSVFVIKSTLGDTVRHLAGRHLPRHGAVHADDARRAGAADRLPATQPGAAQMKTGNPLDAFTLDRAAIRTIGHDLQRPECILAERDGTLWAADARGGVMRIAPDGAQRFIGQRADERFASAASDSAEAFEAKFTQGTLPNGLAFAANGDFLIANFGTDCLELMSRDGRTRTLLRPHRRRADRQGQLRAARFEGPPLAHGLDAREPVDARRGEPRARRLRRGARRARPARRRRRLPLHERGPARCARGMALRRGDHRAAPHAPAARRVGPTASR